jgi:hypothetical protein
VSGVGEIPYKKRTTIHQETLARELRISWTPVRAGLFMMVARLFRGLGTTGAVPWTDEVPSDLVLVVDGRTLGDGLPAGCAGAYVLGGGNHSALIM